MKKICFLQMICFMLFTGRLYAQGMVFTQGTWAETLKLAKEKNLPVFIDVYTSWCGPCKEMSASVFTRQDVGAVYNKFYINYKIDAEKGEGIALAKKYQVKAYPTYLYIDPETEQPIHKVVGLIPAATFIDHGNETFRKYKGDKPVALAKLDERFHSGNYDQAWLEAYIKRLHQEKAPTDMAMDQYMVRYIMNDNTTADQYAFFALNANMQNDTAYQLLCANYKAIDKAFSNDGVAAAGFDNDMVSATSRRIGKISADKSLSTKDKEKALQPLYANLKTIIAVPGLAERKIADCNMRLYTQSKDTAKLVAAQRFFMKKFLIPDNLNSYIGGEAIVMNKQAVHKPYIDSASISSWGASFAVYFLQFTNELKDRQLAQQLMDKCMRFGHGPYMLLMQNALLYNMQQKQKAIAGVEKLLPLLESQGEKYYAEEAGKLLATMQKNPATVFGVMRDMHRAAH